MSMHGIIIDSAVIVWIISEILIGILRNEKGNPSKQHRNKSTSGLYIVTFLSISMAIYFSQASHIYGIHLTKSAQTYAYYLAVILIVGGILVRGTAILTLKQQFSVNLTIIDNHKLIDNGIYHYLRHPSYSGALLSFLGLCITFLNWLSLIIVFFSVLAVYLYRIGVEEKMLINHFGNEYVNYSHKTKRIIPYIY